MKRVLVASAAAAAFAAVVAVGNAHQFSGSFACPPNPKTQPLGKIYGNNRGSSFCNDRARATAFIGKQRQKLTFAGGVCWKSKDAFSVGIGTAIAGKRLKADPPGFWLQDFKPRSYAKESVDLGKGTVTWGHSVKIKYAAGKKSGTWSGTEPTLVKGKLTYIPAKGSFTCKRVLDAPDQ
jgi:hypothetical protein